MNWLRWLVPSNSSVERTPLLAEASQTDASACSFLDARDAALGRGQPNGREPALGRGQPNGRERVQLLGCSCSG